MELGNAGEELTKGLKPLSDYFKNQSGFLEDPEQPQGSPEDFLDSIDLEAIQSVAMSQTGSSPTTAAVLASYRDIQSIKFEMELLGMKRGDYWKAGQAEASERSSIWADRMQSHLNLVTGRRQ